MLVVACLAAVAAAAGASFLVYRPHRRSSDDDRDARSVAAAAAEDVPAILDPPAVRTDGLDPAVARAIEAARQDVLRSPRSAGAWGRLGTVLLAHELPAEANACLAQAERLDPREPRWPYLQSLSLVSGRPDEAAAKLRRAVELAGDAKDAPDAPRLRLAELLLDLGRVDEAEAQYRAVLRRDPRNPRAELGTARVAAARGDLHGCLSALRRPARDGRTRRESLVLTAQVQQRRGEAEAARRTLRDAAAAPNPAPWPDPWQEEVTAARVGRQASIDRANALLAQNRAADAAQLLRQAVKDHPDSDLAWLLLGRALLGAGDAAGAEAAFRESARLAPEAAGPQYHLGIVLLAGKQYPAAAAALERAVTAQPDFAPAHVNLGRCRLLIGDRGGAVAALRTALRHDPNAADAHEMLGTVLAAEGKRAEAIEHLRSAVELNPSSSSAKARLERLQQHRW